MFIKGMFNLWIIVEAMWLRFAYWRSIALIWIDVGFLELKKLIFLPRISEFLANAHDFKLMKLNARVYCFVVVLLFCLIFRESF